MIVFKRLLKASNADLGFQLHFLDRPSWVYCAYVEKGMPRGCLG